MTVDTAATSPPEPVPVSGGSDARLSRLHEALKQLRAKSTATVPLASIAPVADEAPVVPSNDLSPSSRTVPLAIEADRPAAPIEPAVAKIAPPPESPRLAQPAKVDPEKLPEFCLESWFSPVSLRQYRQMAGNIASQLPAEPAAFGVAALSCRHSAEQLAARLALCLAERREGDVLLVEPAGPRWALAGDAHGAGLADVVAGRADWADAVSSTEMEGLSLIRFGSTAAPEDAPLNDQWRTALADLKRRYRFIVSAARPGECFASDAWLAAIDGVYLAVSLGDAPRKLVAACHSQLKSLGARLLGCIAIQ